MLSVDDALARVLKGLAPLAAERVSIGNAHRRVLAEDLAAKVTQPPFDASAMDGYAVRAADVAALPATLKVVGESAAGAGFRERVETGEAVRIFTGAPVPGGADAIIIQEDAEAKGDMVVVRGAGSAQHIRRRGQDFIEGKVLLHAGIRLNPRTLMLAASMNHAELAVRRKPKVAILATGNEVAAPGSVLGADQIVSSVPCGLAALVEAQGGEAVLLGIAKDDPESITTLARTGGGADILVTIGGASVGEHDLVVQTLRGEGLELDFAKVAMRPGKPTFYGRLGEQRLLGVPGNPVSALVCGYVFLVPMLHALLGLAVDDRPLRTAVLGEDVEANGPRQHYMRAMSSWREDGERVVRPLPSQDSSLVAAFAEADCLIVRVPQAPPAPKGARVKIIPLAA